MEQPVPQAQPVAPAIKAPEEPTAPQYTYVISEPIAPVTPVTPSLSSQPGAPAPFSLPMDQAIRTDVKRPDRSSDEADNEDSASAADESLEPEPEKLVVTHNKRTTCAKVQARCWYLTVPCGQTKLRFLVDSGSEVTIVQTDTFKRQSALARLPLKPCQWSISGIGGNNVAVHGVTVLPLIFNGKEYAIEALVADVAAPGVLGMNFLEKYDVSSNFYKGELMLDGEIHLLQRKDPMRSFQVQVARATVVPAYSEAVIQTRPTRPRKIAAGRNCCIQPASTFASRTGLALGGTLVTSHARSMPVLVVNPTNGPVFLRKGLVAATCVPAISLKAVPTESATTAPEGDLPSKLPDHLERMVPKTTLSKAQQSAVRAVLARYADVFMSPEGELGKTSVAKHRIDLEDDRPFKMRLRRAAIAHQEIMDQEVRKMLAKDIIEPSDSPWASPVVMVKKKDGSWRFCVDYRKLNDITRKDSYPLPHIEDTFDALAGSHYFCALDLASGYWQVEMEEGDKEKTAFVTKQGLYQFKVMPFGL